nr:MAG: hypothetical protein AM324_04770 [Candidatus Thorarchaeota archaeon SMTZ1-83]
MNLVHVEPSSSVPSTSQMGRTEEYVSNCEYETYYGKLNNLRSTIAASLPISSAMRILDVATGEGFFAIEVAKYYRNLKITGVDISRSSVRNAKKNVKREGLGERVEIVEAETTRMNFERAEFDMAINFTGLEDIHMTRGRVGVQETFFEVNRVLKPKSHFCLVVMPPEEMETEAEKIEVALFSYICDATWFTLREYEEMLEKAEFRVVSVRKHYTGKKLTPQQAKSEIRFACKNVPRTYGIETPSFQEIWAKFGETIREHGLGHYSKVVSVVAQKSGEVGN